MVFIIVVWPNLPFQFKWADLPEWVSAVVPIEPTFVAGPLVTNKFFRSVGSLGLSAYSGEFWGG